MSKLFTFFMYMENLCVHILLVQCVIFAVESLGSSLSLPLLRSLVVCISFSFIFPSFGLFFFYFTFASLSLFCIWVAKLLHCRARTFENDFIFLSALKSKRYCVCPALPTDLMIVLPLHLDSPCALPFFPI